MAMRLVLFTILWLSLQAYSQVTERPDYRVGDKWVVERFDLWKNEVTDSREWRITEISAASMTQEFRNPGSGAVLKRLHSTAWASTIGSTAWASTIGA